MSVLGLENMGFLKGTSFACCQFWGEALESLGSLEAC